jgi:hypothetical protein
MATDSKYERQGESPPLTAARVIVPEHAAGDDGPERGSSNFLYRAAIMMVLAAGVGLVVAALDVT